MVSFIVTSKAKAILSVGEGLLNAMYTAVTSSMIAQKSNLWFETANPSRTGEARVVRLEAKSRALRCPGNVGHTSAERTPVATRLRTRICTTQVE